MKNSGFTLIEILIAALFGSLVLIGLMSMMANSLDAYEHSHQSNLQQQELARAMLRIREMAAGSKYLLLPLADNPRTTQNEAIISALAFSMGSHIDRDDDGFADADNDRDGKIDEDIPRDMNNDGKPGIKGVDDNNDGKIDNAKPNDDDEDGTQNEDTKNLLDDDNDGMVDEDFHDDVNGDGEPGFALVDDDMDGLVDEGDPKDDDEDSLIDEDWIDSIVYYLQAGEIVERLPNPHAISGDDYSEIVLVENVTQFQVTRLTASADKNAAVNIHLEITDDQANTYSSDQTLYFGDDL